jgi:oligo-1,6-glucosidase
MAGGPRLHEFLRELRTEVLDNYDTLTVGEMPFIHDRNEVLKAVGADRGELNMIFEFSLVTMDFGVEGRFSSPPTPWTLKDLKNIVNEWQTFLVENEGWNSVFLENHDQPRSYRFLDTAALEKDAKLRERAAKMLGIFMLGQSGTLFVYQGQEIGMVNIPRSWGIEEYKDVETQNRYQQVLQDFGADSPEMQDFMEQLHRKARDHARTPMQVEYPHPSIFNPMY